MNATTPRYQLLEGELEVMQEAINGYADKGYRLVSLAAVRVHGSGVHGTAMNEYCAVLERESASHGTKD